MIKYSQCSLTCQFSFKKEPVMAETLSHGTEKKRRELGDWEKELQKYRWWCYGVVWFILFIGFLFLIYTLRSAFGLGIASSLIVALGTIVVYWAASFHIGEPDESVGIFIFGQPVRDVERGQWYFAPIWFSKVELVPGTNILIALGEPRKEQKKPQEMERLAQKTYEWDKSPYRITLANKTAALPIYTYRKAEGPQSAADNLQNESALKKEEEKLFAENPHHGQPQSCDPLLATMFVIRSPTKFIRTVGSVKAAADFIFNSLRASGQVLLGKHTAAQINRFTDDINRNIFLFVEAVAGDPDALELKEHLPVQYALKATSEKPTDYWGIDVVNAMLLDLGLAYKVNQEMAAAVAAESEKHRLERIGAGEGQAEKNRLVGRAEGFEALSKQMATEEGLLAASFETQRAFAENPNTTVILGTGGNSGADTGAGIGAGLSPSIEKMVARIREREAAEKNKDQPPKKGDRNKKDASGT